MLCVRGAQMTVISFGVEHGTHKRTRSRASQFAVALSRVMCVCAQQQQQQQRGQMLVEFCSFVGGACVALAGDCNVCVTVSDTSHGTFELISSRCKSFICDAIQTVEILFEHWL